jgi:hypothetical protein
MATIAELKKAGFADSEIAQHFTKELRAVGFAPEEVNQWLSENQLIGTIREDTMARRASNALRGTR